MEQGWTALVPIKAAAERKQRLAQVLAPEERIALTETLLARLLEALAQVPRIAAVRLLAPVPQAGGAWLRDQGRGLNAELEAARRVLGPAPLLVIHPDLPDVTPAAIAALLDMGEASGRAAAPDRHGRGTNAVALADGMPFAFVFGPESFALHVAAGATPAPIDALARDIDTAEDLADAYARGALQKRAISLARP